MGDVEEDSSSPKRKKIKTNKRSQTSFFGFGRDINPNQNLQQKIRFVVISKDGDGDLNKISPFVVNKAITGCCGEPINIKKLRNGSFLVECGSDAQADKLMKLKSFFNVANVKVEPHIQLNRSKGVIRNYELLNCSEEEMLAEFKKYSVIEVKQVISKQKGPTPMFILTFETPTLPKSIEAGYLKLNVRPYIPAPLRCFHCFKFGHITGACGLQTANCKTCSKGDHKETDCINLPSCVNCIQNNLVSNHDPLNYNCPTYQKERKIKEIQATKKITHFEARKQYEQLEAPTFSKSYAQKVINNISTAVNIEKINEAAQQPKQLRSDKGGRIPSLPPPPAGPTGSPPTADGPRPGTPTPAPAGTSPPQAPPASPPKAKAPSQAPPRAVKYWHSPSGDVIPLKPELSRTHPNLVELARTYTNPEL